MIEAVFPSSVPRCARRISTILLFLGVLVWLFFPSSAQAGTETATARWITIGALGVTGVLIRVLADRGYAAFGAPLLLVGGAFVAPATWLVPLAIGCVAYLVLTFFPRTGGASADVVAESPELPGAEVVRENIEAVAMALVLALTVRQFAVEAFVIPTGSMQPTILGELSFPADAKRKGDRLVASKIPVLMNDLDRFSIIVFRYPMFRPTNYIKRLIGLPGEHLEIKDGDVWVNGERVTKPDPVQETLWFREFPDPDDETPVDYERAFDVSHDDEVKTVGARADLTSVAGDTVWLEYDGYYAQCNDWRVGATLSAPAGGEAPVAVLRVDAPRRRVELRVNGEGAFLLGPGVDNEKLDGVPALTPGGSVNVALAVADGVARVYVDGRLTLKRPLGDAAQPRTTRRDVRIGVESGSVTVTDFALDRDIHYEGTHSWDIPEDSFVMLGDNTSSSQDSRMWNANVVTDHVRNKVYVATKKMRLDDGPERINYHTAEGHHVFLDQDGIERRIKLDDASVEMRSLPFVHRSDLIGRAFFIFYPFPPFGDFRPRFLP